MNIESVTPKDYAELLVVWEDSVRATHDFISDEDIEFFKPIIIEQAFPAVVLRCIKDNENNITGFLGTHDRKIEMLFIYRYESTNKQINYGDEARNYDRCRQNIT